MECYTTQQLLRPAVERILNIRYANYEVFGKTAEDDAIVRRSRQQEHDEYVRETADAVENAAKAWEFAAGMTADDCSRLKTITQLLTSCINAKPVSIAQLRQALTAAELAAFDASLHEPIVMAEVLYADGVPDELKRYNIKLRDADFTYHKYEKMNGRQSVGRAKYKHDTLKNTYNKSEHLYERALEYLEEQIGIAARDNRQDEVLRWLDRDVDFSTSGKLGINADQVPRVKGSRSHYAQDSALPKMSKRLKREQRMLEALLAAADAIVYMPEVADATAQVIPKLKLRPFPNINPERD
jgi:hypothetical protein